MLPVDDDDAPHRIDVENACRLDVHVLLAERDPKPDDDVVDLVDLLHAALGAVGSPGAEAVAPGQPILGAERRTMHSLLALPLGAAEN
ncbi:MAG TPA: hypothetical protein VGG88_02825, partial [Gaiellaceae bacterium]